MRVRQIFIAALFVVLGQGTTYTADVPSTVDPANVASPTVVGRWEKVSLRLREISVTRVRVGPDKTIWVGTSDGLLALQGLKTYQPKFANAQEATALIVKDILPLGAGEALVGTINGSIWLASFEKLSKLIDLGDRSEHTFAQLTDGTVLISNSFGRLREEQLEPLRVHGIKAHVVPGSSDFAVVWKDRVWLVGTFGSIESLDWRHGERAPLGSLNLPGGAVIRAVSVGQDGRLYLATDVGCGLVETSGFRGGGLIARPLVPGACRSIVEGHRRGELWAGTADGVYLFNGASWQRWSHREGLDFGPIGDIAEDGDGNLWVGANGIFRYFNYFREIPLSSTSEARSIESDGAGGVLVGFGDGMVEGIRADGAHIQVNVGSPMPSGSHPYYPGALLRRDGGSGTWILNHNGLYLYQQGHPQRVADYPIADPSGQPITSLAVRHTGSVYCGQVWTGLVYQLTSKGWKVAYQVKRDPGGSSVPAMAFDADGNLWVVGMTEIYELSGADWRSFGPFQLSKTVKKNFDGALALQADPFEVFAFGPWGYPVRIRKGTGQWAVESGEGNEDSAEPWIVSRIIVHPSWGRLAATEQGLYRWHEGRWQAYDEIDPRLSWLLKDVALGDRTSFWILSKSLWQVRFPASQPRVLIDASPSDVATKTEVMLKFDVRDVEGPQGLWKYHVRFYPPVYPYGEAEFSQRAEYHLSNLVDGKTYQFWIAAEDAFGNTSEELHRAFTVRVPWSENPRKVAWVVAWVVIIGLLLILLLITRRGPTGFFLRLLGGRRWRIQTTGVDLAIEVEQSAPDGLVFRLRTPTRMTTVVPRIAADLPSNALASLQRDSSALADSALRDAYRLAEFGTSVGNVGQRIYASLPEAIRFAYEQTERSRIQLTLDDSLLNIFWELWRPSGGGSAALLHAIGRQVSSSESSYKTPEAAREFCAVLLAPETGTTNKCLDQAIREVSCVKRRLESWGAKVALLPAKATKQQILEAVLQCQIFHYAGHALFDSDHPEKSHLPIYEDVLTAEELDAGFKASPSKMFLAFVNGCESGRENPWNRGKAVFGLASVFLKDSTFFVGAQWPVQDGFGWEFADAFYRNAFPTSGALWWRWLRGKELSGLPIAEALQNARRSMSARPETIQTWPAYVYYGDPSSRIEWS